MDASWYQKPATTSTDMPDTVPPEESFWADEPATNVNHDAELDTNSFASAPGGLDRFNYPGMVPLTNAPVSSTLPNPASPISPSLGNSASSNCIVDGPQVLTIDPRALNSGLFTPTDQISDGALSIAQTLDGNSSMMAHSSSYQQSPGWYASTEVLNAAFLEGSLVHGPCNNQPSLGVNIVAVEAPTINPDGVGLAPSRLWQANAGTATLTDTPSIQAYHPPFASSEEYLPCFQRTVSANGYLSPDDHQPYERGRHRRGSSSSQSSRSSWSSPYRRSVSPATSNTSGESELRPYTPQLDPGDISDDDHVTGVVESLKINVTSPGVRAAANKRRMNHTHTYKCDICDESLTSLANLQGHKNSHNGVKPFSCTVGSCLRSFARDGDRKRHEKEFHNPASFTCGSCDHVFKRQNALREHQSKGKCYSERGHPGVRASEDAMEPGYKAEEL